MNETEWSIRIGTAVGVIIGVIIGNLLAMEFRSWTQYGDSFLLWLVKDSWRGK